MKNFPELSKYLGWITVSSFVYFQFLIQTSSSIMQSSWAQYFNLSPLEVSYLSAAFFYTYLFFQIPVGLIYDRYNAKTILIIATLGLGLGCLLFANSHQFQFAVGARMLMGACAAFGFIGMLKVTSTYFPGPKFPIMMGISESVAAIFTMTGIVLLGWAITKWDWQQLMIYFAVSVFFVTIGVVFFINSKPTEVGHIRIIGLLKNIFAALTNSTVLITGIYGFFMAAIVNAFTSLWGVSYLTSTYQITSVLASKIMSTVFLGLAVGCPISGYLSKNYGNERFTMQVCALISAMCMASVIYLHLTIFLLYFMFFVLGLMCSVYVQAFTIVGRAVDQKIQATSMAVTNMLIMAGAPLLQILIGAILETNSLGMAQNAHQNYQIALSILPIGMLVAFGLCFFMKAALDDLYSSELGVEFK